MNDDRTDDTGTDVTEPGTAGTDITESDTTATDPTSEDSLRGQAVASIHRKRAFQRSLLIYVLVNALLVGIWLVTKDADNDGFWPIWVIGGWGIGLVFQGWHAYGLKRRSISDDQVRREMERLRN